MSYILLICGISLIVTVLINIFAIEYNSNK